MGSWFLKFPGIGRVLLLQWVSGQFPRESVRVGEVQDDKLLGKLGMGHREAPRDHPTPVMAADDRLFFTDLFQHRGDIFD